MKSPQWVHKLFAEYAADAIPGWLIWLALSLSLLGIGYGLIQDWSGFLLNVSASIALIGPGLFITNRVIRNWRDRRLRPLAADAPRHLAVVLRRLGTDLGEAAVELSTDFTTPNLANENTQSDLGELANAAQILSEELEHKAETISGDVLIPKEPAELTLSRAVAQLGYDLDRLDVALSLPAVRQAWARMEESVKIWDDFRLASAPASGDEVLLAARDIASATQQLARRLATDLPRHLS